MATVASVLLAEIPEQSSHQASLVRQQRGHRCAALEVAFFPGGEALAEVAPDGGEVARRVHHAVALAHARDLQFEVTFFL